MLLSLMVSSHLFYEFFFHSDIMILSPVAKEVTIHMVNEN